MEPAQWVSALNNPEFKEPPMSIIEQLRWKKYPVLNDGHICLVDVMGNDAAIVQAARISYGNDSRILGYKFFDSFPVKAKEKTLADLGYKLEQLNPHSDLWVGPEREIQIKKQAGNALNEQLASKDRNLIRYLLNHSHTTPFEMVEFKFRVRVPMDCWRQWIRHRTANINEYSTRYSEAIDSFQTTEPTEWRLQASNNKQGSEGFLEEWPEEWKYEQEQFGNFRTGPNGEVIEVEHMQSPPSTYLSERENLHMSNAKTLYKERLALGIAKEQARKDLPLSTYTEAYWKCDLHNIFNFLRLRMDSHAQYEIRMYANAMAEIVKQVVPIAWEAFEDYVLYAKKFSRMEMEKLRQVCQVGLYDKPDSMTDREWREFLEKLA